MKHAVAFVLPLALAACGEEATGTDLELDCPPGPVYVGQTIHIEADLYLPLESPDLEWVQLSEGGEVSIPEETGDWYAVEPEGPYVASWTRAIDVVATVPGRTRIGFEWVGDPDAVPLFPTDSVTWCEYDILPAEAPAGLEVTVRRAGVVVSKSGDFRCAEGGFATTDTEVCTQMFSGTAFLLADPDESFGFTQTRWFGCDGADGNFCSVQNPNGRRVTACFHDGTPAGITDCEGAQP